MSLSHVGRAVQFIAGARKTTGTQIGANGGVSQVVISRASNGSRLETRTLKALCNSQPEKRDNLEILIGHLRDEIERAGHATSEIEIVADVSRIDDDLRVLIEESKHDEQLRGMLSQLASFVRTHPLPEPSSTYPQFTQDENLAAAEDSVSRALTSDFSAKEKPPTGPKLPPVASAKHKKL